MIPITKTKLPDLSRYVKHLERAWKNGIVTNGGELVSELEDKLAIYLGVKHVSLVNNGTIGLMIALKAAKMPKGNIITTPYTYVATTSSIRWAGYDLKFADISAEDFNINPDEIISQIDNNTVGIMPVHVYGVPCNIKRIQEIANDYKLKVVYDASHCFGVTHEGSGESFVNAGDYSVMSLHATKVLGTGEGGLIISKDEKAKQEVDLIRAFGLRGDTVENLEGMNGKLSELHAAFGLASLEILHHNLNKRKRVYKRYKSKLSSHKVSVYDLETKGVNTNYLYFPILVDDAVELKDHLTKHGIASRRYFYPSLDTVYSEARKTCSISNHIATKILCLPIFPELTIEQVDIICDIINNA